MLGKQRLVIGIPYGRISIDLAVQKELLWALVPPVLLALTFLSLFLLQGPTETPMSVDGLDTLAPASADELYLHYADWRQTDESYLPFRPVFK